MDDIQSNSDSRHLTAEIVASFIANNSLRSEELPELISSVYDALMGLGQAAAEPAAEPLVPPVSIRKSLHNDYLISMEDGKQYQSLKRHLSKRGLTPADYRAKWGLPNDYPMTAPGYSERRSALAKSLGLGQLRRDIAGAPVPQVADEAPEPEPMEPAPSKPKRGRKKADA